MESKYFYRFRSVDKLLDSKKELLTQTIYFAEPSSLNDPMEGSKIIFWKGDCILWENFFRHYIFSLTKFFMSLQETELSETTDKEAIEKTIVSMLKGYPTEEYYKNIFNTFIGSEAIVAYIHKISKLSLSKQLDSKEIIHILSNVHQFCIDTIRFEIKRTNPNSGNLDSVNDFLSKGYFDSRNNLSVEDSRRIFEEQHFASERDKLNHTPLINNLAEKVGRKKASMMSAVYLYFPELYLGSIDVLMHPKWYTSCFMSNESNSAVWGHYGDNHKGVCLKFKADGIENADQIKLFDCTNTPFFFTFHEVKYKNLFPEIDFFNSLGRFSHPVLSEFWIKSFAGKKSNHFQEFTSNYSDWKGTYWNNFLLGITTKTSDWEYENEYRLVLDSFLNDSCTSNERLYKYEFSSLVGIIFGINTPIDKKFQIIDIVKAKCKSENRREFFFYQAFYKNGRVENFDLCFDLKSGKFNKADST